MSPVSARLEQLAELHDVSPLRLLEFWIERASIREHLGGCTRAEAERLALQDVESELEGK